MNPTLLAKQMLFAPVKCVKVFAWVVDNDGILLLAGVCQSFDEWS